MSLDHDHTALVVNSISVALSGVVASTWLNWFPPLVSVMASVFAVLWYAIQIWESNTVRRWRRSWGWNVPIEDEEI